MEDIGKCRREQWGGKNVSHLKKGFYVHKMTLRWAYLMLHVL